MKSWEDWDYWLRMTHLGICFTWIEKPLVEYRFDTGSRRALANPVESGEDGRQLGIDLIQYLQNKYEGKEKLMCGGCKKHRALPTQRPAVSMANSLNSGVVNMTAAGDTVWVQLIDNNIGSHPISFGGTNYNYRIHGERFKMLRAHADLDMRVIIVEGDIAVAPSVEPDPLPEAAPPPQYAEWAKDPEPEPVQPPAESIIVQDFNIMETMASPGEKAQAVLDADEPMPEPMPVYDLTQIWGITEEREAKLQEMGIRSPQAIAELGEKVIASRLDVTDTVAGRIIKSAGKY